MIAICEHSLDPENSLSARLLKDLGDHGKRSFSMITKKPFSGTTAKKT
jgi:hypothetical protein